MTAAAEPVCVVAVAGLTAAVRDVPVYPDGAPAASRLRRHGRPWSRPLPGPVHRVRVEVRRGTGAPMVDEHVCAGLHAPGPWPRVADVLLVPGGGPADVREAAAGHPGALVVAAYRGERCGLRYGGRVVSLRSAEAEGDTDPGAGTGTATAGVPGPGWRWRAVASAVHAWLAAGLLTDPLPGPVRLRTTRLRAARDAPVAAAPRA
ncbi:hypothetical protein [Streptomyces sp. B8F3]|uniref:hypothetical protein n=1 Tax=unclassified Streptomyces TaxID=2593676 RepID=UPI00325DAAD9